MTEAEARFDAYLAHCAAMLAEARGWTASVPAEVGEKLVDPAIWRSLLELMPRMPAWMAEHLNGARPAVFRNPDGSETEFIEWPFSGLFNPSIRDRTLIDADRVAAYRQMERAFLDGVGRLDWSQDTDPAAACLTVPGIAALIDTASGRKPNRRWQAEAQALIAGAGAAAVARNAGDWLAALGPADAHRAATPDWQQIGTLRLLSAEMDRALANRLKSGSSALQKAARAAVNPEQAAAMQSSRHAGGAIDRNDPARRAAHRQFGYWGRLPFVDPRTGLRRNALLPGDPRCLSAANAVRAQGASWLLAMAAGADAAAAIAAAADSLAAKVYHAVGYPAPRSVVAAKACLETVAAFPEPVALPLLRDLEPRIDHPPLRKWISQRLAA